MSYPCVCVSGAGSSKVPPRAPEPSGRDCVLRAPVQGGAAAGGTHADAPGGTQAGRGGRGPGGVG